jgi:membrane-associated protein
VLDRIIEFLRPYLEAPWGYLVVGAATFLENSVGAGVIVPGETIVILGGVYAGLNELSLPFVATVAVVGAILGDNVGYWIGRRFGRGFLQRFGEKLFVTPERLGKAERYYAEHGGKTVFLGRFVPFVRSVGFVLAGVAHMQWKRFIAYDVAGALIWGVGHSFLGYVLGASYERWQRYATPVGLGLLVILLFLVGASKFRSGRRKEGENTEGLKTDLEPGHLRDQGD